MIILLKEVKHLCDKILTQIGTSSLDSKQVKVYVLTTTPHTRILTPKKPWSTCNSVTQPKAPCKRTTTRPNSTRGSKTLKPKWLTTSTRLTTNLLKTGKIPNMIYSWNDKRRSLKSITLTHSLSDKRTSMISKWCLWWSIFPSHLISGLRGKEK